MMWSSRLGKHPLSLTARVMAFVALAIGLSLLVIGYLVDNAVKYTPPGGRVIIGADRDGEAVILAVADNGPGIPESVKEAIFMPMISGRADGTGLGLSIAQSILNQHKGLIECNSQGGLTTFSLFLPLEY